jgi:hypothetical protein
MRRSRGTTTVEFAIVAAVLFTMIFGVFEVGRGYYTYAMLDEVSRRGARLAAVCPVNDPAIPQLAIFNPSGVGSDSPIVFGLAPGNVVVDYLDANSVVVGNPADPANFPAIRYVRVRITGFVYQVNVPFIAGAGSVAMPEFETILPRESLGVPREGAITPC